MASTVDDHSRMSDVLVDLHRAADSGTVYKVDLSPCPVAKQRAGVKSWSDRIVVGDIPRADNTKPRVWIAGDDKRHMDLLPISEELVFLQRYIGANVRARRKSPEYRAKDCEDPCEYFLERFADSSSGLIFAPCNTAHGRADTIPLLIPRSEASQRVWSRYPNAADTDERTVVVLWKSNTHNASDSSVTIWERVRCRVQDLLSIMPPESDAPTWKTWSYAMQWTWGWNTRVRQGERVPGAKPKPVWPNKVFTEGVTAESLENKTYDPSTSVGAPFAKRDTKSGPAASESPTQTKTKLPRKRSKTKPLASQEDKDQSSSAVAVLLPPTSKRRKRVKDADSAADSDSSGAARGPGEWYEFNHASYLEKHLSDAAWSLPILIELTCERHMYMQGVKLLAILWYADPYIKEATHKHQDDVYFEAFHWRKNSQGKDSVEEESSRSGFFHQVVHVETLAPENEGGATPAHPAMQFVGLFFSSFHTVPRLLDMNVSGWDAWKVHGVEYETMRKLVLGTRKRQFINPSYLEQRFDYPGYLIDRRIIKLDDNAQPTFAPRDLLVNICRQECNAVRCAPMTYADMAQYRADFNNREPPTTYCPHGIAHYAPEEIDLKTDKRSAAQRNLDVQLTEIGRMIRFDDVKFTELEYIVPELLRYPFWSLELMDILQRLQQLSFPQTRVLRQQFHRSWNDELLMDNVVAVRRLVHYYKPLTYLSYSRPCSRSDAAWIEVNTPDELKKMVIMVEWHVRSVHYRMLDKWRGNDLDHGEGGTLRFMVRVPTLVEALKDNPDEYMTPEMIQELYDEVLSKDHYKQLQEDLTTAKLKLEQLQASDVEHKHLLSVSAERAVHDAEIDLEWADDTMHIDSTLYERKQYQQLQKDVLEYRKSQVSRYAQ